MKIQKNDAIHSDRLLMETNSAYSVQEVLLCKSDTNNHCMIYHLIFLVNTGTLILSHKILLGVFIVNKPVNSSTTTHKNI